MMFLTSRSVACVALLFSSLSLLVSTSPVASHHPSHSHGKNAVYPDLIEATTEELAFGLEKGLFTSVDLVNVSFF